MNIHQYGTLSIARDSLHVSMQLPHQPSTCNCVSHMIHLPKSTGFIREAQEVFHLGKKVQVKRDVACQLAGVFFSPHIIHTYPLHVAIWPWLYWMLTLQQRCFFSRLQSLPWPHATEWQKDLTSASAVLPTEMDTRCYFQNPWFGSPTSEVFCGLWRLKLDISLTFRDVESRSHSLFFH